MTASILAGSVGTSLGLDVRGLDCACSLSLEPDDARLTLADRLFRFSLLGLSRSLSLVRLRSWSIVKDDRGSGEREVRLRLEGLGKRCR